MTKIHDVKITVLKRFKPSDVFKKSPATFLEPTEECTIFNDGQEFICENTRMPNDFCNSAWHSIYPYVRILAFGGDPPWYKEKGIIINSCVDGLRPVIFKLERM